MRTHSETDSGSIPPETRVHALVASFCIATVCFAVGGCDFDPAAGIPAAPDAGELAGDATAEAEATGDSCTYRGNSTGVCSEGFRDDGSCQPPESWVAEEGPDGGCGDSLDNDCDGETDENCACVPGSTDPCYTGPAGTSGIGVCELGQKTCTEEGTWAECKGDVTPSEDVCGNGRDEDCNGTIDDGEGCACEYDGTDEGVCSDGVYDSSGTCTAPAEYESSETSCQDGRDNDCDGDSDLDDSNCQNPVGGRCTDGDECRSETCAIPQNSSTGHCAHRMFVTSKAYAPDFGQVSNADAACDQIASTAGLTGDWKAVISGPNNSARDRLVVKAPIANLNDQLVAVDGGDLWDGDIANPVGFDQSGASRDTRVWTGSDEDGTWDGTSVEAGAPEDCQGWTSTSGDVEAEVGSSTSTGNWLKGAGSEAFGHHPCDQMAALYCIDGQ